MRAGCGLVLAAAASLAACRSAPPPAETLKPYKVVLLPVEGSKAALDETPGEGAVLLALTPEELDAKIRDSVKGSRVFSDVVDADPAELSGGAEERMQAASDLATRKSADLILRIQVKSARMTDLGNNGSTFWSTLSWFMLGLPSFWVNDRSYETHLVLQAELYDPADPVKPTVSVPASSGTQELDLWDRGLSPLVFVVPPAFLKGSASSVSETLTERAVKDVLERLVHELRTREIPSRFEMDVTQEGGAVNVTVVSQRRLRSLQVEVDGRPVKTWAETDLVEDRGESTPERLVYAGRVTLDAKNGAQVRVIADDEAGVREVRTLVIGGLRP